jgi:hypothetical protein
MELCFECRYGAGYRALLSIYEGILTVGLFRLVNAQNKRWHYGGCVVCFAVIVSFDFT